MSLPVTLVQGAYIVAGLSFILALAGLSRHETARAGNRFGIIGMTIALVATILAATAGTSVSAGRVEVSTEGSGGFGLALILAAMGIGAVIGLDRAKKVEMTGMRRAELGRERIARGELGEIASGDKGFSAELRGPTALLERPVVEATSPECRAALGDRRCRIDMAGRTRLMRVAAVVGIVGGGVHGTSSIMADEGGFAAYVNAMGGGMISADLEDPVALSVIAELTNMVNGQTLMALDIDGVDLTPPQVITGENIKAVPPQKPAIKSFTLPFSVVPSGTVFLVISIYQEE